MDDLVAFLSEQWNEMEAAARAASNEHTMFAQARTAGKASALRHIAMHDPAAALADVESKRRLLALHSPTPGPNPSCNTYDHERWKP